MGAIGAGVVSLLTTFLILFMYLDYSPFYREHVDKIVDQNPYCRNLQRRILLTV